MVVLGHGFWQSKLSGDSSVLGVVGYVSRLVQRPEEIAGLAAGETRLESCPTARRANDV